MRTIMCCLILSLLFIPPVSAQEWKRVGERFVLHLREGEIGYQWPGVVLVGRKGTFPIKVAIFLWHDEWIYERLEAGTVLRGPELDSRGWIRQSGTWVTRDKAPPMKYTLALEPMKTGVTLHLETEKTADLKLTAGLWCVLDLDDKFISPQHGIYACPNTHGTLSKSFFDVCETLLVELSDGYAAAFEGEWLSEVRHRGGNYIEMNIYPNDFPVGHKAKVSLKIGFRHFPEEFPGEIKPQRGKLYIGKVSPSGGKVPLFGKVELTVDLRATWDNPFDPDDIALDAVLTTASGKQLRQPGFFMVDYERKVKKGAELMMPRGEGKWRVRFTATEVGPLRCTLIAKDRTGTLRKELGPFIVVPSAKKGFVRLSNRDPHYLQFDNGAGFFPIGHNLPIYHTSGQLADEAIRKMSASGENYNRWWMSSNGLGIEWEEKLGWYRQVQAARLDYMLDLAEKLDFYYMLCMDTHQDFREEGWKSNPYNRANGGPCASVRDWFTNEQAKALYKKRLRYIVARWGYSPQVLCWEFGNEFEGWADTPEEVKIEWHREMASYLASLDPYRHLVTTSWWSLTGPEKCWQIPEMDIVQTHCYTNNDANVAEQVRDYCLYQWSHFNKPHIFGEFGIRSHTTTADKDPNGWALHNAFWVAVCSGCCGIPMPWWHENYIDPLNLYFHFTAIKNFVKGLPFGTERWEQVEVGEVDYVEKPAAPLMEDVTIIPTSGWRKPEVNEFIVAPDGSVNDVKSILSLLQGMGHPDLRNPPTFIVNYPQGGKFIVSVGRVSNSGLLRIWVDGELKLERQFPCGEKIGKSWEFRPQWNLWESVYDEEVAIDVPAGKHRILVDNLGKDWMQINRYVFTGCKTLDRPNLLVAALRCPRVTIVWIQNRDSDWFNHQRGEVRTVPVSRIALQGFRDGIYQVEWWETWKGVPASKERVRAKDGWLVLLPGEVKTDLAAKITPVL